MKADELWLFVSWAVSLNVGASVTSDPDRPDDVSGAEKLSSVSPAFANKVVDKVGSGDAMFAMISLCKSIDIENDLALFFGSISAASSVETIGNSFYSSKKFFLRQLEYSLK